MGGTPLPATQERAQARYQQILDAALSVFSRRGYREALVDEIATEAETSKGGLYFHFPGKQAIFLALLDRSAGLLLGRVREAVEAERDPVRKADAALLAVLRLFAGHRSLARLFLVEAMGAGPELHARMAELYRQFAGFIEENLDEAVRAGAIATIDTRLASQVWFGALKEVVTSWVLAEKPEPLERQLPALRALLFRSVGVLETPVVRDRVLIHSYLAEGVRRARRLGRPVLVSWSEPCSGHTPIGFFARGRGLGRDRALWWRPAEGRARVGIGLTYAYEPDYDTRFRELESRWRELVDDAVIGPDGPGPALIGGLSFAPDPPRPGRTEPSPWQGPRAELLLPRFGLTIDGDQQWLTTNVIVGPDDDPDRLALHLPPGPLAPLPGAPGEPSLRDVLPPEEWMSLVGAAVAAIRAGDMEKVVLAREVELRAHPGFQPEPSLARLAADYPTCTVFAMASEQRCFLGASPERLVGVEGGRVQVSCLAGTTARGATPAEDERLGKELLSSPKNRAEHAVVARMLRDRLGPLCDDLTIPDQPELLKVRNVQHLHTPVIGLLRKCASPLGLVETLHPTPAVGGFPDEPALRFIEEYERLDRGWYAGPFGWVDARGDADFAVALRSGVLFEPAEDGGFRAARLYAGCGIVGDSDPEAELEESRLKLRPVLAALGGVR